MSKAVSIKEGPTSKQFGQTQYLRTHLYAGGTCDWVPEDDRKLTTKIIRENGVYFASDERDYQGKPYYAYSEIDVDVDDTGYVVGIDPDDGNEYYVAPDEETGELEKDVLPSYIDITTQPTKTSYQDGETIDITGMVVKAYKEDGTLWEAAGYTGGVIPLSEINFEPTVADAGQAGGGSSATSSLDLGDVEKPFPIAHIYRYKTRGESTGFHEIEDGMLTGMITNISPNGWYIIAASKNPDAIVIDENGYETHLSNSATYDGKRVYYYRGGGTYSYPPDPIVWCSPNLYQSAHSSPSDLICGRIAWTMIYGDITGGEQDVTVKWNRPNDSKELTDTFSITVEGASQSNASSGSSGEHEGGGGGHAF